MRKAEKSFVSQDHVDKIKLSSMEEGAGRSLNDTSSKLRSDASP